MLVDRIAKKSPRYDRQTNQSNAQASVENAKGLER